WQLNGTYFLTSGATWTPSQSNTAVETLGNSYLTAGTRPYLTNPNADRRLVGINAFDAYLLQKITAAQLTSFGNSAFLSLTQLNATGTAVVVTPNDVKYVFNGPGAAQVFGSPFGSAGRNIERGPRFNQLNMGLFKNIKVYER